MRLGPIGTFGRNIPIVKAVEINLTLLQKLKKDRHPCERIVEGLTPIIPWHVSCTRSKRISQGIAHTMPVSSTEAQVILHAFTGNEFVRVVVPESERVVRARTFKFNLGDVGEVV